jgi:hypothetical protein
MIDIEIVVLSGEMQTLFAKTVRKTQIFGIKLANLKDFAYFLTSFLTGISGEA